MVRELNDALEQLTAEDTLVLVLAQPAWPSQLMQRAAGSVEPPAGPTAVFETSTRELRSHADHPAPATVQQGIEAA
jgi:hypothetical protein